jgi:hypothetical protein
MRRDEREEIGIGSDEKVSIKESTTENGSCPLFKLGKVPAKKLFGGKTQEWRVSSRLKVAKLQQKSTSTRKF